ncbi:MAG TPA: hypothetical protein EYP04_03630 [Anaerolineae bacterium]|nr:hypothetical protein [Anaerolineae bacterium]
MLEATRPYGAEELDLVIGRDQQKAYSDRDFRRDLRAIIEYLQAQSERQVRLVLLMDEADVMNQYDELTQQQLRRVFMETFARNVGAVVSGVQLSKAWERVESPWYNLFNEIKLSPFTRAEAEALIREPVRGVYEYDDDAVELIIEYGHGRPHRIQQLCLEAVNHMLASPGRRTRITVGDVRHAIEVTSATDVIQVEKTAQE